MFWNLYNQLIKKAKGDVFNIKISFFDFLTSARKAALVSMTFNFN
jgi:hypothetical protein